MLQRWSACGALPCLIARQQSCGAMLRAPIGWGSRSTFGHLRARGFEDLPFAFREALDAVRGNFVENGIDFLADEFGRLEFHRFSGLGTLPKLRFLGAHFDQFAPGRFASE